VKFKAAIIGCGRPRKEEGSTGFGMGHYHARGYEMLPDVEVVACADIKKENAEAFSKEHGGVKYYLDYREMLEKEKPDIVSICTWIALHKEMVIAAAEAGVKAIHCEKPMAPNFGDAKEMVEFCEKKGVQLTFNHQRRFGAPFRKAKELANDGTIGDLVFIEGACSDMLDWGTHWIDMFFFYNNEESVNWVMGQVDCRAPREVFGVLVENQAISQFMFRNGVRAILFTGEHSDIGCSNRLVGTKGVIEVGPKNADCHLRYYVQGEPDWVVPELKEGLHGADYFCRAIADTVDALKTGREPELSARRALKATEVIFATYESSRRRARIDLPLDITDNPLHSMIDAGEFGDVKPPERKYA